MQPVGIGRIELRLGVGSDRIIFASNFTLRQVPLFQTDSGKPLIDTGEALIAFFITDLKVTGAWVRF